MKVKSKFKDYYIFIILGLIGLGMIIFAFYYYFYTPKPKVSNVMEDLTPQQLPPDVFCKLVEKGLNERTPYSWNCTASNDTYGYDVNESKIYNLTEALCDCYAMINDTLKHIQVRRAKK